jgi:chloramphenicol-sensitive protein RarD
MDSRGLLALLSAFTIWGLLPLYLRPLHAVPALQIMAHRLLWCCVLVIGFLAARGNWGAVREALGTRATRQKLVATALLISTNWVVYVWSIGNGRVVESSLGYFINPLVNVLLGVVILRERLTRTQWSAVGLAAVGVLYLSWLAGAPPFIALVLAFSFSSYGLLRKTMPVDAMVGLGAETLLLAPAAVGYLVFAEASGHGALRGGEPLIVALLLGGGLVTAVPLWLFSFGARRVRYSTVGVVQYIGPSLQLVLGLLVFHEPFSVQRLFGFALIWTALLVYAADGYLRLRQPA